ncbi:MAG: helix-turn-helix transcriptional regulator [Patescibacteria group bacterium]
MRNINDLTTWSDYEKKLLTRKGFKKLNDKNELQFQLIRSLINARLKKKLSQKELAKRIGSKQPVISRLENMESHPTLSLLERISFALDTKLHIYFQA